MKEIFYKLYNSDADSFYALIKKRLKDNKKTFIVTANTETFMISNEDSELRELLNYKDTIIVPDGIAIVKAGKQMNYYIKERITGIDIANKLLKYADELSKKVFLFGAEEKVIVKLKEVIKEEYPNIDLVGVSNGYVKNKDKIFDNIAKLKPDIVMVAMGIPKQEKLIYKHIEKFDKGIFVGVGGSFDVMSGLKKRCPQLLINLNLEWLYRIIKEPKRIKRFVKNNIEFIREVKKIRGR